MNATLEQEDRLTELLDLHEDRYLNDEEWDEMQMLMNLEPYGS